MKIWWPWSCVWSGTGSQETICSASLFSSSQVEFMFENKIYFCAECLLSMSELAFQASLESLLSSCSKIVNDAHKWRKNEMYDFWLTEAQRLLEFSISDTPSLFSPRLKAFIYYLISMHILTAFYSLILLFGPRSRQPSFKRDNK